MIIVLSRVKDASMNCDGVSVGSIGQGLVCFVGFEKGDDEETVKKAASKIPEIRIFEDDRNRLGFSLKDVGGAVMLVSNFTLAGSLDGRRMTFDNSMPFSEARALFDLFCSCVLVERKVCSVFGSYMDICMTHDGPVNIVLKF